MSECEVPSRRGRVAQSLDRSALRPSRPHSRSCSCSCTSLIIDTTTWRICDSVNWGTDCDQWWRMTLWWCLVNCDQVCQHATQTGSVVPVNGGGLSLIKLSTSRSSLSHRLVPLWHALNSTMQATVHFTTMIAINYTDEMRTWKNGLRIQHSSQAYLQLGYLQVSISVQNLKPLKLEKFIIHFEFNNCHLLVNREK